MEVVVADKVYNVLFICTGNSARSIIAESVLNFEGRGRFKAYSAGSNPSGGIHPKATEILSGLGFPTEGLRSKSWDEYAGPDAPDFDFIITVCDVAAGERCPVWPGRAISGHWGIEDPKAVDEKEQPEAFLKALRYLRRRIELFLALPHESLDKMAMERKLREIGESEGSTKKAQV
jgi:arsenate reductase